MTAHSARHGTPLTLGAYAETQGVKPRSMREHRRVIQACDACAFRPDDTTPLLGDGPLPAPIVVVSHAARQHDLLMGRGLAGAARNVVDAAIANANIAYGVRFTAAIRCVPPDGQALSAVEQSHCREHLLAELLLANPTVVVTLGEAATGAVLHADVPFAAVVGRPLRLSDTTTLLATVDPRAAVQGRRDATVSLRRDFLLANALVDAAMKAGDAGHA
jgi:uracil-DNA glycosylase family 4